jgi:hypothetical protein
MRHDAIVSSRGILHRKTGDGERNLMANADALILIDIFSI